MNITKRTLLIMIMLLSGNQIFAQWIKVSSIPNNNIVALKVDQNTIYAASGTNEIYKTSDNGLTWTTLTVSRSPIDITSLIFYKQKIYGGTFRFGVFTSKDNGNTWENSDPNLMFISDFAVKDNVLYASTLGRGVAVLDTNTNKWLFINDSLPDYSINVQSIIGSQNFLMIAAGANGTFYKYNFGGNNWNEGFYYGFLRPGLLIDNLINNADTILAVNGNRIIKTSDAGENWINDDAGAHNGFYRNTYTGSKRQFILTNLPEGGTWVQMRDKYANSGTSWEPGEEFLPGGFSYDIIENDNKLFLGRNDGLYVESLVTGNKENGRNADIPTDNKLDQNYPNPFNPSTTINFQITNAGFVSLKVYNILGKEVATLVNEVRPTGNYSVWFDANALSTGVYFYQLTAGNFIQTKKMIVLQ
jgi:photosystem II stability/assembly factor-like uncharacterized protein